MGFIAEKPWFNSWQERDFPVIRNIQTGIRGQPSPLSNGSQGLFLQEKCRHHMKHTTYLPFYKLGEIC